MTTGELMRELAKELAEEDFGRIIAICEELVTRDIQ